MMTPLQIERSIEACHELERRLIEAASPLNSRLTRQDALRACGARLEALAVCMERTVVEMEDA